MQTETQTSLDWLIKSAQQAMWYMACCYLVYHHGTLGFIAYFVLVYSFYLTL